MVSDALFGMTPEIMGDCMVNFCIAIKKLISPSSKTMYCIISEYQCLTLVLVVSDTHVTTHNPIGSESHRGSYSITVSLHEILTDILSSEFLW